MNRNFKQNLVILMATDKGRHQVADLLHNLLDEVQTLGEQAARERDERCDVCGMNHNDDPTLIHPSAQQVKALWAAMRAAAES